MKSETFKNWLIGIGCVLAITGIVLGSRADTAAATGCAAPVVHTPTP